MVLIYCIYILNICVSPHTLLYFFFSRKVCSWLGMSHFFLSSFSSTLKKIFFLIFTVNLIFPCRTHFFSVCYFSPSLSVSIVNMFAYGCLFRVWLSFMIIALWVKPCFFPVSWKQLNFFPCSLVSSCLTNRSSLSCLQF